MLFINKLELNNRVWLRKLARGLGLKLVPNFDVEELVMVNPVEGTRIVLIGDSMDDYECIQNNDQIFKSKYMVDENYKLVQVLYKDVDACTMWCESRIKKIDKLKVIKTEFVVEGSEENDLILDMFQREVDEYLKCADMRIDSYDGVYTVKIKYINTDEKAYNKIKEKYGRKLHTKEK